MQHRPIPVPAPVPNRTQLHAALMAEADISTRLPGPELATIADLARQLLGSDISAFSILDDDWQWLTARCGITDDRVPRDLSFCGEVVDTNAPLLIPDAAADPAYRAHPLVVGPPHVRAYAGVPVVLRNDGCADTVLGSVCVVYHHPRRFSAGDVATLRQLAALASALVQSHLTAIELANVAVRRQDDLQQLARTHRQLNQAERMAGIGSWRLDLADDAIHWSDQVYAIHDLPHGETPALDAALTYYPVRSRAVLSDAIGMAIDGGRSFDEEVDFVSATGTPKRVRCMGEVELMGGRPVALIGVFQDVTHRYGIEQALRRSASTDELTGLANRAGFNFALAEAMALARRTDTPLSLLLIDLDGFKAVNDRCGHQRGDTVLKGIADALRAPGVDAYVSARVGGDEFALIVPQLADDAVAALAADLLDALRCDVAVEDGETLPVSGTIGIGRLEPGITDRDLLRRADVALYHGKHSGRARAVWYDPALDMAVCRH